MTKILTVLNASQTIAVVETSFRARAIIPIRTSVDSAEVADGAKRRHGHSGAFTVETTRAIQARGLDSIRLELTIRAFRLAG